VDKKLDYRTAKSIKRHGSVADYPHMMKLWNNKKNKVNPKDIASGSHTRRFWICSRDHSWRTPPRDIKRGTGCNLCARPQTSRGELRIYSELKYIFGNIVDLHEKKRTGNREADIFIEKYKLAIEYDGDIRHGYEKGIKQDKKKNEIFQDLGLTLIRVRIDRLKKISEHEVKFKDGENHKLVIDRLIKKINSCVELDKNHEEGIKSYLNKNDFANEKFYDEMMYKYPNSPPKGQSFGDKAPKEVVEEWDKEKNKLTPYDYWPQSHDKAWWICKRKKHSYDTRIQHRFLGGGCRFCPTPGGTQGVIPSENSFGAVYPQLIPLFHKTRNKPVTAFNFVPGSSKQEHWWKCTDCREDYYTTPKQIFQAYKNTNGKRHGCPYCSGPGGATYVGKYNNLKTKYPKVAKDFDIKRNGIEPDKVLPGSVTLYYWKCQKCKEEYERKYSPNYMTSIRFQREYKIKKRILHPRCKYIKKK